VHHVGIFSMVKVLLNKFVLCCVALIGKSIYKLSLIYFWLMRQILHLSVFNFCTGKCKLQYLLNIIFLPKHS